MLKVSWFIKIHQISKGSWTTSALSPVLVDSLLMKMVLQIDTPIGYKEKGGKGKFITLFVIDIYLSQDELTWVLTAIAPGLDELIKLN